MSLRHAATVCVVRSAPAGYEVLLGKRALAASFMGGAHVFPGGSIDEIDGVRAGDHGDAGAHAAVRETFEEMAIALTHPVPNDFSYRQQDFEAVANETDPTQLLYLSTWVTPAFLPIRFDTRFYLCAVPADTEAIVDGHELIESAWITPTDALAKLAAGDWQCASPTIAHLKYLSGHPSLEELWESATTGRHLDLLDQFLIEGHRLGDLGTQGTRA